MDQLSDILTELMHLFQQQCSSIDLAQEFDLANRALVSGVEAQMFRAIELLVLSVHAVGGTQPVEVQQAPVFLRALRILRMSGRPLPLDLPGGGA